MDLKRKKQGQAILEIALFGSIILALLGIILQYGLKFGFQQRAMMRGFRRTLAASGDYDRGNQGSYTYFEDRHVPDPSNPIGVGSVANFISGSSVVRNYMLINSPDDASELPITYIRVNDDANTYQFNTANFRTETINESDYDKYKEIYGDLYIKDPSTNGEPTFSGGQATVRIMDSCEGNLPSYEGCKKQCRMMEETEEGRAICRKYCERGGNNNCTTICNQHVEQPWYCSSLDNIFSFAIANNKPEQMGIQSDYTKQATQSEILRKQEAGGVITTTDTINWSETTNRTMVYMDDAKVVQSPSISSTLGESVTQTCVDGNCP